MKRFRTFITLPREITQFELAYLRRLNRVALAFFALHVPVFALIAWSNHTGPVLAAVLATVVLLGPTAAVFTFDNPRSISVIHGISAMFMGALLVHFGQGPAQIEMHFYFFALLAMCAVFGNPMVIVASTITVVLHHVLVWLVMPSSVFNYDAQWWVVGIHAVFILLEAVATCFIARSFFDNVIGLERIVQARTSELDTKNQDMRMLLDNVQQGFLRIDRAGQIAAERSAQLDRWFGVPSAGASWFDYLGTIAPAFETASRIGWTEVVEAVMPLEVTLDQMPRRLSIGDSHYNVEYRPIGASEPHAHFLVIVTDVTAQLRSERASEERREVMSVFERALADRPGLEAFLDEGSNIMQQLVSDVASDAVTVKRLIHTLKGNAALYGLVTISRACHELEDQLSEIGGVLPAETYTALAVRWQALVTEVSTLLGQHERGIEITDAQYESLEAVAKSGDATATVREVRRIKLEPTSKRLRQFAEQAQRIAARMGKQDIVIRVEDHGVRLESQRWAPFWAAFVHGVRNAIDHGIEPPGERNGKSGSGTLTLRSRESNGRIVIEIEDDGRGIDWEVVRERAISLDLPCTTSEELQAALFVDGFSTTKQVSDISGRGIGMGVLLERTHALGGTLSVVSRIGEGTVVRMSFPAAIARGEQSVALAS
jgi:two-component system, chemotaxis family, sensor kinase CheA